MVDVILDVTFTDGVVMPLVRVVVVGSKFNVKVKVKVRQHA